MHDRYAVSGSGRRVSICSTSSAAVGPTVAAQRMMRDGGQAPYSRCDFGRLLTKLARVDVLVIDDWGLTPAREQERRNFLEILEDRYGQRSTIMTSQLPTKSWHEHLADQTLADAILDRILHNAHRLVLKGPSRRKPDQEAKSE